GAAAVSGPARPGHPGRPRPPRSPAHRGRRAAPHRLARSARHVPAHPHAVAGAGGPPLPPGYVRLWRPGISQKPIRPRRRPHAGPGAAPAARAP
nr:hypothetical protein [Tanacetum cinerariifolium]